tara:strand:+ start:8523 stop:8873 length:351 start_codon:yes stop_codon:yes gene_type:complete
MNDRQEEILLAHYGDLVLAELKAQKRTNDRYDSFGPDGFDTDYPDGPIGDPESLVNEALWKAAGNALMTFHRLLVKEIQPSGTLGIHNATCMVEILSTIRKEIRTKFYRGEIGGEE